MRTKNKGYSAVLLSFVTFIIGLIGGFGVITYLTLPLTEEVSVSTSFHSKEEHSDGNVISTASGEVSVHFLELGNKYTGDCTYIKAGEVDILIDCGSKASSVSTVSNYLNKYVTDNTLEYVIVTHAHQDHYAGFATTEKNNSIFDLFICKNIITFSQTNQKTSDEYINATASGENTVSTFGITSYASASKSVSTLYKNFNRELQAELNETEGAVHLTATEVLSTYTNGEIVLDSENNISLQVLESHYYSNKASSENDYSVCCLIKHGERNFLFTGDLEEEGEEYLVELNTLPQVELYKAGHHGSKTSSSTTLMQVIQPKNVCVCCCAGSSEYTSTNANQFPTQIFINNVAPYTKNIYVTTLCINYDNDEFTSLNGNIVCISKETFAVQCSANNTILKETEWFKQNRTWPANGIQ